MHILLMLTDTVYCTLHTDLPKTGIYCTYGTVYSSLRVEYTVCCVICFMSLYADKQLQVQYLYWCLYHVFGLGRTVDF